MFWFKIILLAVTGLDCILDIARANGWNPKRQPPGVYATSAVINTILFIGIWLLI